MVTCGTQSTKSDQEKVKKVTVEILFNDPNKMGNVKPCEMFYSLLPIICIPLMSGKAQDLIREAVCMSLLL